MTEPVWFARADLANPPRALLGVLELPASARGLGVEMLLLRGRRRLVGVLVTEQGEPLALVRAGRA